MARPRTLVKSAVSAVLAASAIGVAAQPADALPPRTSCGTITQNINYYNVKLSTDQSWYDYYTAINDYYNSIHYYYEIQGDEASLDEYRYMFDRYC